jgi:hypothetical protein
MTAIAFHALFNFTQNTSVSVQVVEVLLRGAELVEAEIRVEVQLIVTIT